MHDDRFTPDELRALLDAWGLDLGPDAILTGIPDDGGTTTLDDLKRRSLLTEEWGTALRCITHPVAVVRVLQALPDTIVAKTYLTDGSYPDLVGCWPDGDGIRIGFPFTPVGTVHDASSFLNADFPAQIDPLRLDLSIDGLACLAAAVDTLRAEVLDSLVARRGGSNQIITRSRLEAVYAAGLSEPDGRWLVTLLHMLMPLSVPLPVKLADRGIDELTRHGLIAIEPTGWRALAPLTQLTSWLLNPLPAIAHEVVVVRERVTHAYRYLIALRGSGPVWTIEFWKDDPPAVTFRSRIGSGYRKILASVLAPLEEAAPAGDVPTPRPAESTGHAGAPEAHEPSCPQCAMTPRPGAAFCTSCGASLRA
jgi:hypothetical protein